MLTRTAHHAELPLSAAEQRQEDLRVRLAHVLNDTLGSGTPFSQVTVELLLQHVGVARSTFYVYFDDKGDLLAQCYAHDIAEVERVAGAWWELGDRPSADRLSLILDRAALVCRAHQHLLAAAHGAVSTEPAVALEVRAAAARTTAALGAHIVRGQAGGWITAGVAAEPTARWLVAMAGGGLADRLFDAPDTELQGVAESFVTIVWQTLYASAAALAAHSVPALHDVAWPLRGDPGGDLRGVSRSRP